MFIKNFDKLATIPQRKIVLELIETAFSSIQPEEVINKNVNLTNDTLVIKDKTFNLKDFDRIFLLGFGKGSARNSRIIEEKLGDKLTEGWVIDTNPETFKKIKFTQGTHPLPSAQNVEFTDNVSKRFKEANLTQKDLVLVIICGGGSAMLAHPYKISLEKKIEVGKALLHSGANIIDMNIVRQHLSTVKGGGLCKILYPSTVASLIFSDVPGNNLSYIASGPTVKNDTSTSDAIAILKKYNLWEKLGLAEGDFLENPKEDKYFENVFNILVLSNLTALEAMKTKAQELGYKAGVYSDKFEGEAKIAGQELINRTQDGTILLVGGETTVIVAGSGQGGRNQEVVLGVLSNIGQNTVIASFDSDGWDNSKFAGAIGDFKTLETARELNLNPQEFLDSNNSLEFFEKVGDGIETGRLPSNVSDLIIVSKALQTD